MAVGVGCPTAHHLPHASQRYVPHPPRHRCHVAPSRQAISRANNARSVSVAGIPSMRSHTQRAPSPRHPQSPCPPVALLTPIPSSAPCTSLLVLLGPPSSFIAKCQRRPTPSRRGIAFFVASNMRACLVLQPGSHRGCARLGRTMCVCRARKEAPWKRPATSLLPTTGRPSLQGGMLCALGSCGLVGE